MGKFYSLVIVLLGAPRPGSQGRLLTRNTGFEFEGYITEDASGKT